jgi:uncharacterized membrane protein
MPWRERRRSAASVGEVSTPDAPTDPVRTLGRWLLGAFLLVAGTGHFVATEAFLAQVPAGLPFPNALVLLSGVAELVLGVALVALPRWRVPIGWAVAVFFVLVFPGNVGQALRGTAAFGLDSDAARWGRLAFQPVLVLWALWSTGAWRDRAVVTRRGRDAG